jgi:hypothetical protein
MFCSFKMRLILVHISMSAVCMYVDIILHVRRCRLVSLNFNVLQYNQAMKFILQDEDVSKNYMQYTGTEAHF